MANYVVTTRAANGSLEERSYTANDRSDLFKQLAADGVAAVSVREGVASKKKQPRKAASGSAPSKGRGLIAAAIVVLGLGAAVWFMWPKGETKSEIAKDEKVSVSKRSTVSKSQVTKTAMGQNKNLRKGKQSNSTKSKENDGLSPDKRIVEIVSVVTNADGSVYERFRTADGKLRSRQSAPKEVFDNASDQLIAMAISGAESGGSMPPMPMSSSAEKDFVASLKKEIVINDDDPERVKNLKRAVMETRQQIHEMMAEGKSFAEILREHQDLVNNNAMLRSEAKAGLEEIFASGDREGAEAYLKKVNELLREHGAAELEMPLTKEERRRLILERQAGQSQQ